MTIGSVLMGRGDTMSSYGISKTRLGYLDAIEDLLDSACDELKPEEFEQLKKDVKELVDAYTY